ncbi:MAG: hypothetical protein CMH44_07925 [Muricauda sp.]|nr:hypothetical protein [uncultured Allomuricauda sp.]MAO16789.1 hypothetical protein [Allomuricauda sp.]MBC73992.1 hypothetical protein [Allomuricauda sp.]|tara:strand:- start:10551 stop:10835 length:285 start_codon:yes stop_codon:yes gene_type:complete
MKRYTVYRNIRMKAMIMGLPITLFALMMVSVICSLLIVIFSFHVGVIVGLLLFNVLLYGALGRWVRKPFSITVVNVFPSAISNKPLSPLSHVQD